MKKFSLLQFYFCQSPKRVFAWGMIFVCILLGAHPYGTIVRAFQEPLQLETGLATVETAQGLTIYAELADTPQKREQGLMYRVNLAPDRGMLFVFPALGYWTFWMKNTKMPLDILWVDQDGLVVHMEENTPTCERTDDFCPRYTPLKEALFVLEIRGGQAEKTKIRRGSHLKITLPSKTSTK